MPKVRTQLVEDSCQVTHRVSDYAHIFRYQHGLILAYNSLSGSLMNLEGEAGNEVAIALEQHMPRFEDSPYKSALIETGFLVDADVNELNVVREIWRKGQRKKCDAMLTILPTLACNFDCPYCFERHIKGLMSTAVQDALVKFTARHLLPKTKKMSIDWFGGEPLAGLSVIESLTARLRDACDAGGVPPPNASITTNGYLLSPAIYRKLVDLGITSAQITLDGPPEIHNRRRPLAGGLPSFDTIIRNIMEAPDEFSIAVRINVDGGNKDHIFRLIELLHAKGIIPRFIVYMGMVESFSEECRSSEGIFLTSPEFAALKRDLNHRCKLTGIPWTCNDSPRLVAHGYCIVDQPKGFVVQPDGKLLKCWAEAGNSTARPVADLLRESTWDRLFGKQKYISDGSRKASNPLFVINQGLSDCSSSLASVSPLQSRDPFDDEECCKCSLLPVCMGGCPTIRESLRHQGLKRCPPLRYSLREEVLGLYYRQKSGVDNQEQRLQSI